MPDVTASVPRAASWSHLPDSKNNDSRPPGDGKLLPPPLARSRSASLFGRIKSAVVAAGKRVGESIRADSRFPSSDGKPKLSIAISAPIAPRLSLKNTASSVGQQASLEKLSSKEVTSPDGSIASGLIHNENLRLEIGCSEKCNAAIKLALLSYRPREKDESFTREDLAAFSRAASSASLKFKEYKAHCQEHGITPDAALSKDIAQLEADVPQVTSRYNVERRAESIQLMDAAMKEFTQASKLAADGSPEDFARSASAATLALYQYGLYCDDNKIPRSSDGLLFQNGLKAVVEKAMKRHDFMTEKLTPATLIEFSHVINLLKITGTAAKRFSEEAFKQQNKQVNNKTIAALSAPRPPRHGKPRVKSPVPIAEKLKKLEAKAQQKDVLKKQLLAGEIDAAALHRKLFLLNGKFDKNLYPEDIEQILEAVIALQRLPKLIQNFPITLKKVVVKTEGMTAEEFQKELQEAEESYSRNKEVFADRLVNMTTSVTAYKLVFGDTPAINSLIEEFKEKIRFATPDYLTSVSTHLTQTPSRELQATDAYSMGAGEVPFADIFKTALKVLLWTNDRAEDKFATESLNGRSGTSMASPVSSRPPGTNLFSDIKF